GEILFRDGKKAEGLAALREAARREDQLRYDEPPDWIQPTRHALGATLLTAREPAEAEQAFRADLKRWPENGWSLFGLARRPEPPGKTGEARQVRARFDRAWRHADVKLTSACFCQAESH